MPDAAWIAALLIAIGPVSPALSDPPAEQHMAQDAGADGALRPEDVIAQLEEVAAEGRGLPDALQLAGLVDAALRVDPGLLDRVVTLGATPPLSEPVGRVLARQARTNGTDGAGLTASRIETALALSGSVHLAAAYETELAALSGTEAARPDPSPAARETATRPPPAAAVPPRPRFVSHGAPNREMGPTD